MDTNTDKMTGEELKKMFQENFSCKLTNFLSREQPDYIEEMAEDAYMSYRYAKAVLKGRFIEGERAIVQGLLTLDQEGIPDRRAILCLYCEKVLKKRWLVAEAWYQDKDDSYAKRYKKHFKLEQYHNLLDAPNDDGCIGFWCHG